jgi:hypothetical protein
MKAIIISVQFLVELPENVPTNEAEDWGIDWLNALNSDCLDYRHPQIAGVFLRPVPVLIKNSQSDEIFNDTNLIQL